MVYITISCHWLLMSSRVGMHANTKTKAFQETRHVSNMRLVKKYEYLCCSLPHILARFCQTIFLLGENLTNLVISVAMSRALLQTFDCLIVSIVARFRA